MARVTVLPESVANKIAAGEVVERPASVVKELVENSMDSGARTITVEMAGGGSSLICVSDDGCGMARGDALLSIERHATSKIRDAGDLDTIETLGFRGEALPSIAAVSKMEILTRDEASPVGTKIRMHGGRLLDVGEEARPPGTTVIVRNIFFNTPARKKFLRSPQTERSHIIRAVVLLALSHPAVSIRLVEGGREVVYSPARQDYGQRALDLLGGDFVAAAVPFRHEKDGVTVWGYAGRPGATRSSRRDQYVFVNSRPVSSAAVTRGIAKCYRRLLPSGRHPVALIFVEVGAAGVDVNVHPTKREVKFSSSALVEGAVAEALAGALKPPAPPSARERPAAYAASRPAPGDGRAAVETPPRAVEEQAEMDRKRAMRVLGQLTGLFIVCESEEGLVVIDQHAAHERVIYEKYMRDYRGGAVDAQRLLIPAVIELGPAESSVIERHIPAMRAIGYDIENFGDRSFAVGAVPARVSGADAAALVGDIVEEMEAGGDRAPLSVTVEEKLIAASCRAAVKRSDILQPPQLQGLIDELLCCEQPSSCPHGRPTMWVVTWEELHRSFKR